MDFIELQSRVEPLIAQFDGSQRAWYERAGKKTVSVPRGIYKVLADFAAEQVIWIELPDLLMQHIDGENVDDIISSLPPESSRLLPACRAA